MELYASKFHWQENLHGGRTSQIYLHVVSCWTKVWRLGRNLLPCSLASARPQFHIGECMADWEILYLPPNLPGSTPKKPNLITSQDRKENPELEDMNHQELVDLVKELL